MWRPTLKFRRSLAVTLRSESLGREGGPEADQVWDLMTPAKVAWRERCCSWMRRSCHWLRAEPRRGPGARGVEGPLRIRVSGGNSGREGLMCGYIAWGGGMVFESERALIECLWYGGGWSMLHNSMNVCTMAKVGELGQRRGSETNERAKAHNNLDGVHE